MLVKNTNFLEFLGAMNHEMKLFKLYNNYNNRIRNANLQQQKRVITILTIDERSVFLHISMNGADYRFQNLNDTIDTENSNVVTRHET